jgi:predicted dehydrogenase
VTASHPERATAFARQHAIAMTVPSWTEMLAMPDLDGVVIAAPVAVHRQIAEAALRRGLHVVCEKPLARTHADAEAMVLAAQESQRLLIYAEQELFAPNHRRLLELASSGSLGPIHLLKHRGAHPGPHAAWFYDHAAAGGGSLMDMGVHGIAMAIKTFGGLPTSVTGYGWTRRHPTQLEDDAKVIMNFGDGKLADIEASWIQPGGLHDRLEVFGSDGQAMSVLSPNLGLEVYAASGIDDAAEKASVTPGWNRVSGDELEALGYVGQATHYIACMQGDATPESDGELGAGTLRVVEGAYASIRSSSTSVAIDGGPR